jgi:hypothetical protein
MTKAELAAVLDSEGFDPLCYCLDGGLPNEQLVLSHEGRRWCVYYSERGLRTGAQCYSTESEACHDLLGRLRGLPREQTLRRGNQAKEC